ncbi:MAG: hypothetical protein DSM106950_38585 [Stigonema ocellatum SAG 48.90 = DSM 106950]|nr:hypothetical protein [Stigonema ocellatum SAG 48.90 = DSM 106950]
MTPEEVRDRLHLERQIEKAFYLAGKALLELRDRRLYRSTHKTFEEYCRDRFGHSRQKSNYLIAAVDVFDNLTTIGCQNLPEDLTTNNLQILPTNERQIRPLTKLEPDQQRDVWQQAVTEAGNKAPSGKIVKDIIERLKEKPLFKASDFCQVGDVFVVTRLEEKEREYNGCWAIALQLNEFTVEVAMHDGKLIVKPENLNKIDSPEAQQQLPLLKERIWRLRNCGELDRVAYTVLESLGRQTYLTPVSEGLLRWLEEYYGIDKES